MSKRTKLVLDTEFKFGPLRGGVHVLLTPEIRAAVRDAAARLHKGFTGRGRPRSSWMS